MKPVSKLLTKFAKEANISHAELAARMELSRPMVNLQLAGKRRIGLARAQEFARALGLGNENLNQLYSSLEQEDKALADFGEFKIHSAFKKAVLPIVLKIFAASPLLDEPLTPTEVLGVDHPVYLGRVDLTSKEVPNLRVFAGFEANGERLALGVPYPHDRNAPPQTAFYSAVLERPFCQQPDVIRALADKSIEFQLYKLRKFRSSKQEADKPRIHIFE